MFEDWRLFAHVIAEYFPLDFHIFEGNGIVCERSFKHVFFSIPAMGR